MVRWPEPQSEVKLSHGSLDWSLNHVKQFGDTIFFPKAFEYDAIEYNWVAVRDWLSEQNMVKWAPRPLRRFLAPKSGASFRYITQLDPLENIAFAALTYDIGNQIESIRIPKQENVVFSWRFLPDASGQLYDPEYRWREFARHSERLALSGDYSHIVMADIADFFPKIYSHPLEDAIDDATGRSDTGYCILRMIKNWNGFVSYGIPVGVNAGRLLAEGTIYDVDNMLRGQGIKHCRYSDDFRLFSSSKGEAQAALESLAGMLFERHGLTLQPSKTRIVECDEFLDRFSMSPEKIEIEGLSTSFHDLLEEAGVTDDYEDIEYDQLDSHIQEQIDELNLTQIFRNQIAQAKIDEVVVRFLLQRLGQINCAEVVDDILDNLDKLHVVIESIVDYFTSLRQMDDAIRHRIGEKVIDALDTDVGQSAYNQACLLSLFTQSNEFDNEDAFEALFNSVADKASKRKLILALGRAKKDHWFQLMRRDHADLNPWQKRAFIAAFSCVKKETAIHFYRSLRTGADILEHSVIKWAIDNPF